jgi:spore coat polysaccharide biosynthesis predicted glycosyltransferase SpsG
MELTLVGENVNIIIRADGSLNIGLGHIYRCLTISEYFNNNFTDIKIHFITQSSHEVINKLLKNYECIVPTEKHKVEELVKNSDIFISDILNTSNIYTSRIKQINPLIRVVCIDNNNELKTISSADVVFNANVFNKSDLKIGNTYYYNGPDYMILREYFFSNSLRRSNIDVKNIFVSFGGSDEKGFTLNVLDALKSMKTSFQINVIIGPMFQYLEKLENMVKEDDRIKIIQEPDNICKLMNSADLAIVSGGITLYEISSLGVPPIVIPQARHQFYIASEFTKNGACVNLGFNPSSEDIKTNIEKLIYDTKLRKKLSTKGRNFVDGKGLKRFIDIVTDGLNAKTI